VDHRCVATSPRWTEAQPDGRISVATRSRRLRTDEGLEEAAATFPRRAECQ